MVKTVAIDGIESGMILAKPIVNNFGQVLLGSGVTLGEKHVRLLKTWSIEFVDIEVTDESDKVDISDELIMEVMTTIKQRMDWEPENKFEEDFFQMAVLNLAEKKMKGAK